MSKFLKRSMLISVFVTALVGCSSTPKMPSNFLNPMNRMTAEDGHRLMSEGERISNEADADIARGKQLVKEARMRRKQGEDLISRGRQTLEAAAMAEEAERLSRKAQALRGEALQ